MIYVEYCHCRQTDELAKQTSSEIFGFPISVNIIFFYIFIIMFMYFILVLQYSVCDFAHLMLCIAIVISHFD